MEIYVFGLGRVILNDTVVFIPKKVFDVAHFCPSGCTLLTLTDAMDAYMLPAFSIADYCKKGSAASVYFKGSVIAKSGV
jgi:hypothetical protein